MDCLAGEMEENGNWCWCEAGICGDWRREGCLSKAVRATYRLKAIVNFSLRRVIGRIHSSTDPFVVSFWLKRGVKHVMSQRAAWLRSGEHNP